MADKPLFGSSEIDNMMLGATQVDKVMYGSIEIWKHESSLIDNPDPFNDGSCYDYFPC